MDTFGISLSVEDFDRAGCRASVRDLGGSQESWKYSRDLPGGGFLATGVGGKAWVEASLPKRLGPDNVEALSLPDALEIAQGMFEEALQFLTVPKGTRFEGCGVVRADFVQDFEDVRYIGQLLDGLHGVAVKGVAKKKRFADAAASRAETLRVGVKSAWSSVLYDKHIETEGRAPVGRLRYETRLRSDWLRSVEAKNVAGNVVQVADLTEEKARAYRACMFEKVGFDREVSAVGRIAQDVMALEGVTEQEKAIIWTMLTGPPLGLRLDVHRNTARKYEAILKRLGLASGGAHLAADTFTVRLDLEAGREVIERAA